jgi:hypothetical protein
MKELEEIYIHATVDEKGTVFINGYRAGSTRYKGESADYISSALIKKLSDYQLVPRRASVNKKA